MAGGPAFRVGCLSASSNGMRVPHPCVLCKGGTRCCQLVCRDDGLTIAFQPAVDIINAFTAALASPCPVPPYALSLFASAYLAGATYVRRRKCEIDAALV